MERLVFPFQMSVADIDSAEKCGNGSIYIRLSSSLEIWVQYRSSKGGLGPKNYRLLQNMRSLGEFGATSKYETFSKIPCLLQNMRTLGKSGGHFKKYRPQGEFRGCFKI
ncbi:hypothetical protein CEXT_729511 [Caerostris extrusa]|uniref:Uncharacterized protein n=1 Tax=Caerostris extrusa TaxID=172846 RepID=A0AAV4WQX5_CAEEX|nr:hypothetical protein CEXT_729511 [Caerostris extrusa]